MAEATRKENIMILADTNEIKGPATFNIQLTAGTGAAAYLTLTVDGVKILGLRALAGTSVKNCECIHLGDSTAVVALTGTGAEAYAVSEVD